jgi:hypothetical protein
MKKSFILAICIVALFSHGALAKTCQQEIIVTGEGVDVPSAQYDARLNWSFNALQKYGPSYQDWTHSVKQKIVMLKRNAHKWTATASAVPCL